MRPRKNEKRICQELEEIRAAGRPEIVALYAAACEAALGALFVENMLDDEEHDALPPARRKLRLTSDSRNPAAAHEILELLRQLNRLILSGDLPAKPADLIIKVAERAQRDLQNDLKSRIAGAR